MKILQRWMVSPHDSQPSALPIPPQSLTTSSGPAWLHQMEPITCNQQHLGAHIPLGRGHTPSIQQRQRPRGSPTIHHHDREWPQLLPESHCRPLERVYRETNLDNQKQKPMPTYPGQSRESHGVQANAQLDIRKETIWSHHQTSHGRLSVPNLTHMIYQALMESISRIPLNAN